MNHVVAWNGGGLALALALSTAVVWAPALRGRREPPAQATVAGPRPQVLVDHSGDSLPLRHYDRIASLTTVGDELLLELCEPDRIVAFSAYSMEHGAKRYRFAGKPGLDPADLERLIALHPDLVLVSRYADARPFARMRDAGLAVYDLGEMRGMATLVPNIHEVAALVGRPERGDRFSARLGERMRQVAADVPPPARKRGLYLGVYGGRMFGGSFGSSYHDVLAAAGLTEAAERLRDFPEYSTEQVLGLDPDVIVTNEGMAPRICEHGGLSSLRACATPGAVVEVESSLLGDPGPLMLDAADAVRAAVYGPQEARPPTEGPTP